MRQRFHVVAALVGAVMLPLAAWGAMVESKVPSVVVQEVLIKTCLLTLNDANITGNYTVLHAKLAKPFREQFNAERLKRTFKVFSDKKIDYGIIVTRPAIPSSESKIDERGALILRGYFDTRPSRVVYKLDFIASDGEWKPIRINVNVEPVNEKQ
ncbi:MAG: hypothetical protein WAL83_15710 [Arenicellales bacterium]